MIILCFDTRSVLHIFLPSFPTEKSNCRGIYFCILSTYHFFEILYHAFGYVRCADDTLVLASTKEGLQLLMNRIVQTRDEFGLKLNINKSKYMIISNERAVQDDGV